MKRLSLALMILTGIVRLAAAAPDAIYDLTALTVNGSEGSITLQWVAPETNDGFSQPTSYIVEYATSPIAVSDFYAAWVTTYLQNWPSLAPSGLSESRTLTGLTPGATLYFALVAKDVGHVPGLWVSTDAVQNINTKSFTYAYDAVPAQVAGLAAVAANQRVNLSWNNNPEIDIKQYFVERSTWSNAAGWGSLATVLYPSHTYQDNALDNGNTYYYRVCALDNTGNLGNRSVVVSTAPSTTIGAVTWDPATGSGDPATINWSWNGGSGALGYRVFNSSSGVNLSGDLGQTATSFIQTGLVPNTSYQVFIRAFNGLLFSDSPLQTVYTRANAPTGLFSPLQPGTTIINLQWPDNGNPAPQTKYSVERSSTNGVSWYRIASLQTATTCQDTGLKEKTTYFYRVWSVNGDGLASSMVSISTMTGSINPQPPTLFAVAPGILDGDAVLDLLAPYDDSLQEPTSGYVVKYATWQFTSSDFYAANVSTAAQNVVPAGYLTEQLITVHGLYPGTTFYFAMKSFDEVGNYSAMSDVHFSPARDNPPPPPINAAASPSLTTEKTINVSWTEPPVSGYYDLYKYVVYRATYNFTLLSQAVYSVTFTSHAVANYGFSDNSLTVPPLTRKTTYYYMVTTLDLGSDPANGLFSQVLESTPSTKVWAYTPDMMRPSAISDLNAVPGVSEGKVALTWTVPFDDDDDSTSTMSKNFSGHYRFDWTTDPAGAVSLSTSTYKLDIATAAVAGTTNYTELSGLIAAATYYFRIWSADASGNWATISNATTAYAQADITPPGQITGFSAAVKWRQAMLSWTAPGDDGYVNNLDTGSKFDICYSPDPAFAVNVSTHIIISTATAAGSLQHHLVTGLNNGTTYYFTIRTQDDWNNWSALASTSALPLDSLPTISALLSPPTDPAHNIWSSSDSPLLKWQDAVDADSVLGDTVTYTIYYSIDETFGFTFVGSTNIPAYQMEQVVPEDSTVYWKVRATDLDGNQGVWTSTFSVRINRNNSAPHDFALNKSTDGAIVNTSTPTLSWLASVDSDPGDSVSYRVEYGLDPAFNSYISSAGITGLSMITDPLVENAVYWWRVWATDGSTSTLCSPTSSYFKVNAYDEAPKVFNLTSPADNTRLLTNGVTFFWEPAVEPDPDVSVTYTLTYCPTHPDFSTGVKYITGLTQPTTTVLLLGTTDQALWDNTKYYWYVTAVRNGPAGLSTKSTQVNMCYTDMIKQLPQPFLLTQPSYGVKISTTLRPVFLWTSTSDPDPNDSVRYEIELSLKPDFAGSQRIGTGTDSFYQPLNPLLDQSTYYWRVRASGFQGSPAYLVDGDGDTQNPNNYVFSSTWVFTLAMVNNPPMPFSLTTPANNNVVNVKQPTFTWEKAVDTDLNDYAVYDLMVSTVPNFSSLTAYVVGIPDEHYTMPFPLLENRNYYWIVRARDRKNAVTTCKNTSMSFNVPVINTPALPSGIRGAISQDENTFTLDWVPVTLNKDGSDIDDLSGYNVYRDVSLQVMGTNLPFAFVPKSAAQFTDNSLRGGLYYYMVRAVDTSGVESDNSLITESLNPNSLSLMSNDGMVLTTLPEAVSRGLLAENNKWRDNLSLNVERKESAELGHTLRSYNLAVRNSTLQEVADYDFANPVELQFGYSSLTGVQSPRSAASASRAVRAPGEFSSGELSVYWHNGVEFIRIGGYMIDNKKRLTVQTTKSGQYQLRQIERPTQFGVAAIDPPKVFTPGIAPYPKITFYVDNPSGDKVIGNVYDIKGEFVARLEPVGDATNTSAVLQWDGAGSPKGVYIYQLEADGKAVNGTIILAR